MLLIMKIEENIFSNHLFLLVSKVKVKYNCINKLTSKPYLFISRKKMGAGIYYEIKTFENG